MIKQKSISKVRSGDILLLMGRLLLAFIFVHEGITLTTHFEDIVNAMAAIGIGLPLVVAIIALQLGAGLSIVLGLLARVGAVLLGLFCLGRVDEFDQDHRECKGDKGREAARGLLAA
jgi:putative oxidoreductase